MNITYGDAANPSSVYRAGMDADGVQQICNDLEATQGFWKELCIKSKDTGTPVQVLSPNIQLSLHSDSDAGTYWEPYVDTVWKQYSSSTLLLDTGYLADGMTNTTVKCQVQSDDMLHCDQGIGNFVKPKSKDIWGCSTGPFNVLCINDDQASCVAATASRGRVIAILCAAFTRSTMHIEALNPSPAIGPDQYYQHEITHHYSRAVHNQLIDGIGYAFPYDDVTPGGDISKSAGLFSTNKPIQLDVIVNA
ncbi:hypothetical protein F5Y18DRAFT_372046 [Xylariaceae sp. FL1019]|nr:hypothetical protein F5Y18DRAFT_372046 [Xylariaceae sp. FL1019]